MNTKILLTAVVLSLSVLAHSYAQTKTNDTKSFVVKIANKIGGKITKDELLKAKEIEVKSLDGKEKLEVVGFTFSRVGKGKIQLT